MVKRIFFLLCIIAPITSIGMERKKRVELIVHVENQEEEHLHIAKHLHDLAHEAKEHLQIFVDILSPHMEEKLEGEPYAIEHNPYKNTITQATKGSEISKEEKEYLKIREVIVRSALQQRLACNLNSKKTPTIACVFSGGGYRAMLCCLGSLRGLQRSKFLDCITHIVGLSGSTWAIAPWISSKMSLDDFTNYLYECVEKPFQDITEDEKLWLAEMMAVKKLSQQPHTLVDLYGGLLGNRLLAHMQEKRHRTYLSEQTDIIRDGAYPYPIYTAVSGEADDDTSWYVFTPHEVRNIHHHISIPTFGCGRTYNEGSSTNTVPELPLSILLGTWGSAFAANWETIIKAAEDRATERETHLLEELKKLINHIKKERPIPCELKAPNFTKGMGTPLSKHKHLQFVDAGTDINLPYPSVSGKHPERTADIIFFFDNSAGTLGKEFEKCAQFAKDNNLPFPDITNRKNIDKKTITIFKGDKNTPTVIYMPGISNPTLWEKNRTKNRYNMYDIEGFDLKKETEEGFCQTQHFQYSKANAKRVVDQTEHNLYANRKQIGNAIKEKAIL